MLNILHRVSFKKSVFLDPTDTIVKKVVALIVKPHGCAIEQQEVVNMDVKMDGKEANALRVLIFTIVIIKDKAS